MVVPSHLSFAFKRKVAVQNTWAKTLVCKAKSVKVIYKGTLAFVFMLK